MSTELSNDNKAIKPRMNGKALVLMSPSLIETIITDPTVKQELKDHCYAIHDPILLSVCDDDSVLVDFNWIYPYLRRLD